MKNQAMVRLSTLNSNYLLALAVCLCFWGCSEKNKSDDYSIKVYQTSQAGDNLKLISNNDISGSGKKVSLQLLPHQAFQEYIGFGASFTESSAWNLAAIPVELRKAVLTRLFSPSKGAGFSLTRTHINSSDYSNRHYTYVENGDEALSSFSVYEDRRGFTGDENDQVRGIELVDPQYDIIPMISAG